MLQNVYRLMRSRVSWSGQLVLDIDALEDLNLWLFPLYVWNGNVLVKKSPEIQTVTEGSLSGYGATCLWKQASGFWTIFIANMPQNAREMMGILMAIHAFGPLVKNEVLQILTDTISANRKYKSHGRSEPCININYKSH